MVTTHGTRTFNQDIGPLARLPRGLKEVVHPASELDGNNLELTEDLIVFLRTFKRPSFRKDTVKVPFSMHIRKSSAGSPPTYPNSIPYYTD